MRKIILLLFIVATITAFGQDYSIKKDYLLWAWGNPQEYVYGVYAPETLVEKTENLLRFKQDTTEGNVHWTEYYFINGGLVMGFLTKTSKVSTNDDGTKQSVWKKEEIEMCEVTKKTRTPVTRKVLKEDRILYRGEGIVAGAFYIIDTQGFYRACELVAQLIALPLLEKKVSDLSFSFNELDALE